MPANCFVCTIESSLFEKLKQDLIDQGFDLTIKDEAIFNAKKPGVTAVLYKSGKLVVQGKEIKTFIEFYLEPEILKALDFTHPHRDINRNPRIGVDEAGKGDYFGPLSVAAVHVTGSQFDELIKIGIKDSKKLDDKSILKLNEKIQEICAFESVVIYPLRYNELYKQFKNLNTFLAWGHSKVIENLSKKTNCKDVLIDQFASSKFVVENAIQRKGLEINLQQRHKAESDIVVAAASIIARAEFLKGMEKMNQFFKINFPKGASSIVKKIAKEFIEKYGINRLNEVAKLHFKTTQELN